MIFPLLDAAVARLARFGLSETFLRFGMVGTLGFCWDTATVYALNPVAGPYSAGTCGFFVAASANWALNRAWTYRHQAHEAPHVQWLKFLIANLIGFVFNRGTYFTLITVSPVCHRHLVLAILAGSAAGLVFNYFLSKRFVFR